MRSTSVDTDEEEKREFVEMTVEDEPPKELNRANTLNSYSRLQTSVGLTWKDVTYTVKDNNNKGSTKQILTSVSGYVEPGKVLCILGPSGSGKTTLLQILCGLRSSTNGDIYYRGKAKKESKISDDIMGYNGNAAYVGQEDLLCGAITVKETLTYAARLKASDKSSSEQESLVNNTIEYLGLKSCTDTLIGNVFVKGISGGQKRRVSIGTELMGQPSLLFMDEITSGLDSTSSYQVMNVIDLLSKKGHTVIITIHQPSTRIFNMMANNDFSMMVLESGRTMYFGKVNRLVPYLSGIDYKIPQYSNPCDYVLDLVNCDFTGNTQDTDALFSYFNKNIKKNIVTDIDNLNTLQRKVDIDSKRSPFVLKQIWILLGQNFLNHLRNPAVYWMRIAMYSMLCLCLGSLYWKIGTDIADQQDRISILFFVAAFLTFMSISGMPAFVEERGIFIRERINNHYSTLAYSIANFLSSLPWIALIAAISSVIIYFMIQSRTGWDLFLIYLLNLFLALLVAESMMVAISALSSVFMVGLAMGAGLLGLYMIVCGFFLLPSHIPVYWKWVHHVISFHTYSFRVFMYNEFHGFVEGEIDGDRVLEFYEMEDTDVWWCFAVLVIMLMVYRICFYVLLRFANRKQK